MPSFVLKTDTKIILAILALPFISFALWFGWAKLTYEPLDDYIDALDEATFQMKNYCKEEKLSPCDFKLVMSTEPISDNWDFCFSSKTHKQKRCYTIYTSSDGLFDEVVE